MCCFSPCVEQVQRTVSSLNEHGFTGKLFALSDLTFKGLIFSYQMSLKMAGITMYETLLRPYEVSRSSSPLPIQSIRKKLQIAEQGKEERRLHQIATSKASKAAKHQLENDKVEPPEKHQAPFSGSTLGNAPKRKHDSPEVADNNNPVVIDEDRESKRVKFGEEIQAGMNMDAVVADAVVVADGTSEQSPNLGEKSCASHLIDEVGTSTSTSTKAVPGSSQKKGKEDSLNSPSELILTQSIKEVRGHTSYLTFAYLLPSVLLNSDSLDTQFTTSTGS